GRYRLACVQSVAAADSGRRSTRTPARIDFPRWPLRLRAGGVPVPVARSQRGIDGTRVLLWTVLRDRCYLFLPAQYKQAPDPRHLQVAPASRTFSVRNGTPQAATTLKLRAPSDRPVPDAR